MVRQDDTPGNEEIFYIHSTDSGATWIGTTRLTWNAGESCDPSIAVDPGGGIHVVGGMIHLEMKKFSTNTVLMGGQLGRVSPV